MRKNIQHSTFNAQHRIKWRPWRGIRRWKLNVECSMFLLFAVAVPSILAQTNINALPALAPPLPELPPTFWEQYGVAIVMVAPVLLALAAIVVWQTLKSKSQPVLPPEISAREALSPLLCQPENGKVLSEVSQVLRRYVGAVFGFSGGVMTTAEFSAVANADAKIGPQLANALTGLLQACDRDKFAAKNEAPPLNAVARALQLIEQIERRRQELNAVKLPPR
jgi:hypothetical protein